MIKHEPIFNTEKVIKLYEEKDGVPIGYVCTSALGGQSFACDIFYRSTPHPDFGNHYFALYMNQFADDASVMITNADQIEDLTFSMIYSNIDEQWHYSQHRHDYRVVEENFIDGGRAYTRTNTVTKQFKVKNGEFYETDA